MPGVFRPYTLVDVIGTLNDQSSVQQGSTINGLSDFAETDELADVSDTVTATVTTNPTWNTATWGTFVWS